MALTEDVQIYKSMYKLLQLLLHARNNFDKSYKYTVGDRLIDRAVECVSLIHFANEDRRAGAREQHLDVFLIQFDILKTLIMVCRDGMQFKRRISQTTEDGKRLPPRWAVDTALLGEVFIAAADVETQASKWRRASRKPESHSGAIPTAESV